jgi:F-type H+-transporting ATPase subunit delta
MTQRVANRYAAALAEAAAREGSAVDPATALEQLRSFAETFGSSKDLRTVLASPAAPAEGKRALIDAIADRLGLAQPLRNFLFILIDKGRTGLLDEIVEALDEAVAEASGTARIEVRSAGPLDEGQKQEFISTFSSLTGKQVRAQFVVDEDLLGGSLVRVGSTLYDGSLRAQLRRLDRTLAGQA